MAIFGDYARYYNLLYRDKDYAGETDFVLGTLQRAGTTPQSLLDLGCGTGRHALEMAKRGLAVTGVDMSDMMLDMGRSALQSAALPAGTPLPQLRKGDARTVRLEQRFAAVTSLFHVMSYQTSEADALSLLRTAHAHLVPEGLFLFDFWYGPCVLTERPQPREKHLEDAATRLVRHATPVLRPNDDCVEVHYAVELADKASGQVRELQEVHTMRYWFLPQLRYLSALAGFTQVAEGAWMEQGPPSDATWGVWMLVRKGSDPSAA